MSDSSSQPNGQDTKESNSAVHVEQRFQLDLSEAEVQFNNIKCPTCKVATPQQWMQIKVDDTYGQTDALDLLQMSKKLTVCQNCGTLRLTK